MALSPDDIVGYEFRQAFKGYAIAEVDELLDRLADQVERTDRELYELRHRLRDTEARLGSALETESTLKRTLVTAQQTAERSLEEARQHADGLRSTAEREAEETVQQAQEEAGRLLDDARRDAQAELDGAEARQVAIEQRVADLRRIEHQLRTTLEQLLRGCLQQLERFAPAPADSDTRNASTASPSTPTGHEDPDGPSSGEYEDVDDLPQADAEEARSVDDPQQQVADAAHDRARDMWGPGEP